MVEKSNTFFLLSSFLNQLIRSFWSIQMYMLEHPTWNGTFTMPTVFLVFKLLRKTLALAFNMSRAAVGCEFKSVRLSTYCFWKARLSFKLLILKVCITYWYLLNSVINHSKVESMIDLLNEWKSTISIKSSKLYLDRFFFW